jgi:hypothetical protein
MASLTGDDIFSAACTALEFVAVDQSNTTAQPTLRMPQPNATLKLWA